METLRYVGRTNNGVDSLFFQCTLNLKMHWIGNFEWEILLHTWFLHQMVAHFTMRTYGVNLEFRFDEGIWLHRKSGQIPIFTSCVRNVF